MKNISTAHGFTTAARAFTLGIASLLLSAAPSAFAATLKADIPFAFNAGSGGKPLPAGAYEFDIARDEDKVTIHGPKGVVANDIILTTLSAPPHSTADHAHLVFDKVGDAYTLSEVWEPGSDGLLVHVTKGKHEHHTIHLKK
ncbi:MAG: hypothetical protein K1Y01_09645 [Vicinamibacteria bacterium]|nr:hypothetical protein [Vicinamibacteria bacterium]